MVKCSSTALKTKLEDSDLYSHFPFYFYKGRNAWGDDYELKDVYILYIKLLYEKG